MAHANAATHDEHSEHDDHGDHSHHVIPWQILVGVLVVLLIFTMLTVNTAQLEVWFAHTFDVEIPQLVNVFVAMSIATVKAMLVCMYFMGLKYDHPLNSIIMLFTLFCLGLFLGFTAADLGNRDGINEFKAGELIAGGDGGTHITTGGISLIEFRRQQRIGEKGSEEAFWVYYYDKQKKSGHPHRHEADVQDFFTTLGYNHDIEASSPERSIPALGVTQGLFDAHHGHDDHGHDDGHGHDDDHGHDGEGHGDDHDDHGHDHDEDHGGDHADGDHGDD